MTYTSTVTQKGQITIPQQLRAQYDIKKGSRVLFVKQEDGIAIQAQKSITSLKGILKTEKKLTIAQEKAAIADAWASNYLKNNEII